MFDSARCLFIAQIQFSLIKKIKIRSPEQSLSPPHLHLLTSHFCLNLSTPLTHTHTHTHTPMCINPKENLAVNYNTIECFDVDVLNKNPKSIVLNLAFRLPIADVIKVKIMLKHSLKAGKN